MVTVYWQFRSGCYSVGLPGWVDDRYKPGIWVNPTINNHRGLNRPRVQASLRPLSGRSVAWGRLLSKNPLKSWRCGLWPHLAETIHCPIPLLWEQEKKKNPGSLSSNGMNSQLKYDRSLETSKGQWSLLLKLHTIQWHDPNEGTSTEVPWDFSLQHPIFCLLTQPLRWKCASSEKNTSASFGKESTKTSEIV